MLRTLLTSALAPAVLMKLGLLAWFLVPAGEAHAQALAPMVGASAIQGTLQGTSMPAYTGVLDRARNTVGATTAPGGQPNAAAVSSTAPSGLAKANTNLSSGAPSGASVNGQPIPLCSHGGLCQGALTRAMGR